MSTTINVENDEFAAIFKKSDRRNGHIQFKKMIYNNGNLPQLLEIVFDEKEDVTNPDSKKNVPEFLKGLMGTTFFGGKRKNTRRKLKKRKRKKSSTKKNT